MAYWKRQQCVTGAIAHRLYLACSTNPENGYPNSRAAVPYVEYPYTTTSFQVMQVSTHKMVYRKETVLCVSSHNLLILVHMQL